MYTLYLYHPLYIYRGYIPNFSPIRDLEHYSQWGWSYRPLFKVSKLFYANTVSNDWSLLEKICLKVDPYYFFYYFRGVQLPSLFSKNPFECLKTLIFIDLDARNSKISVSSSCNLFLNATFFILVKVKLMILHKQTNCMKLFKIVLHADWTCNFTNVNFWTICVIFAMRHKTWQSRIRYYKL